MSESNEADSKDVLRIMVATDNHLGYYEKDAIRGDDSFITFKEILEMAVEESVDFILLGGDLFHDTVPSQNALYKCMTLLRRYVFGSKPIEFEIVSDQSLNFSSAINDTVNYEDPNINISIPVFSIHGNHDDPSSFGRLSSLDLLSTTGLINYVGRWTDLTKVDIKPLLLRKGATQLAIYGLSHIHDERLARLFETYKVNIERPDGDWFHLMVLHQNRAMRGPKNYLPEDILPDYMNLIIWGHEHDCRIEPEHVLKKDFYISQPGSSVATSLAEGEAVKKHVGILKVFKDKFKMDVLPLKTVRPFVFESLDLDDIAADGSLDSIDASDKVRALAEEYIEKMIEKSKSMHTDHPDQPKLPLIRLRFIYSREEHMFNAMRFGQTYNDRVANPGDMVHFKKSIKRCKREGIELDNEAINMAFKNMELDASSRLEDLLESYFNNAEESKKLQVMSTNIVSEITFQMVQRRDAAAVDNIVSNYEEKTLEQLMEALPNDHEIYDQLKQIQASVTADDITKLSLQREHLKTSMAAPTARKRKIEETDPIEIDDDEDMALSKLELNSSSKPTTGRGRGRGRGRGTTRGASNSTRSTSNNVAKTNGTTRSNSSTSSRSTRSTMPELDISVTTSTRRTPRKTNQPSVLESFAGNPTSKRQKKSFYVISDDSE